MARPFFVVLFALFVNVHGEGIGESSAVAAGETWSALQLFVHQDQISSLPGSLAEVDTNIAKRFGFGLGIFGDKGDAVDVKVPLSILAALLVVVAGMTASRGGGRVGFVVAGFMACSSMMLVINKVAITMLPFPATLLALQLVFAAGSMRVAKATNVVDVEPLSLEKILKFGVTPLAFLATLVANIKILEYANVETFIMVRTSTPLFTSLMDYAFLGRELPSARSSASLLVAFLGSLGYMWYDSAFEMKAYSWAAAWLAIFLFDQVYIKHVISTVSMTNWSRVYYTNFLAALPVLVYSAVMEGVVGGNGVISGWVGSVRTGAIVVLVSCVMGTLMSFFSFYARDLLTATSFTVVGNVCKILSVLVNVLIWDKHATMSGLGFLMLCIIGAAFYEPAPLREAKDPERLPFAEHKTLKASRS